MHQDFGFFLCASQGILSFYSSTIETSKGRAAPLLLLSRPSGGRSRKKEREPFLDEGALI
jgi:hypothetical protein